MQEEWVSGKAQISVGGEPLDISFTVPANPVKLTRMLPVFQGMSDNFNNLGIAGLQAQGKSISCKEGCAACCRQLVPVSEAEAFDLRHLIEEMPDELRSEIKRRFSDGVEKLKDLQFFERFAAAAEGDAEQYSEMLREYFGYWIDCPFLENESCSIHKNRPVACREYLVTSPAERCSSPTGDGVENVLHALRVKDTLITVSRNNRPAELPYVPMIQVLEWTEDRADSSPEASGGEWMQAFLRQLMELSRTAASDRQS